MKFPLEMLREFVQTAMTAKQLGDLLTMAGFELEGIDEVEGDWVLDIKVMSNRGDGLSVLGLAREVLAKDPNSTPTNLYAEACQRFPMPDHNSHGVREMTNVEVLSPECNRYACRVFEQVESGVSPEWLQKRIRQAGWRPISLLVDLTNYVMLEIGQPLHAFDLDKLHGQRIVVRNAHDGDKLTTLNGVEHELTAEQMMICDGERPVASGGIMGGLETEVTDSTTRILLESANFCSRTVRRIRKQLGLSTEASYRFERSVDPDLVLAALNRFLMLYQGITGKDSVPGVIDVYPGWFAPDKIRLRLDRAVGLLGMPVTADEASSCLTKLGFELESIEGGFEVKPPSWRPDVVQEDDLIEEIGRVVGYDKIPELPLAGITMQGGLFGFDAFKRDVRNRLTRLWIQTVSHSLRSEHALDKPGVERVAPRNPGSPEHSLLRNSNVPSVAEAARRNSGRSLFLFEQGRVFWSLLGKTMEHTTVALYCQGSVFPDSWKEKTPVVADFIAIKNGVETIVGADAEFKSGNDSRFHPTRQATVWVGGAEVGILGQIHPDAAESCGVPQDACIAEVDLDLLYPHYKQKPTFKSPSRSPAIRRDLAFMISKGEPYSKVESVIKASGGDELESVTLFDVYEGKGVPEGSHSLAVALSLRKHGNFTDEEANQVRDQVVSALERLGAKLR